LWGALRKLNTTLPMGRVEETQHNASYGARCGSKHNTPINSSKNGFLSSFQFVDPAIIAFELVIPNSRILNFSNE
ncbi:hypothetical protein, partial [Leptospira alstonii]|uniref:hypothetical protein n=1 Tax=Leptospira alstonii TaxID=28452 RepID=UPI0009E72EAF